MVKRKIMSFYTELCICTDANRIKQNHTKARSTRAIARDSSPASTIHDEQSDSEPAVEQPAKKKRGGKAPGAQKFAEQDENRLFGLIEDHLPIGGEMWEKVAAQYNGLATNAGHKHCNAKYLKTHYTSFIKSKKPTGDPYCPPNVLRALGLEKQIEEKCHMVAPEDGTGEDDDTGSSDSESSVVVVEKAKKIKN
ncbi:hypothetical protein FPQ18DRAFT_302120 [Pyronema domesticum]|nr:hypothetical protein FPQ18DRAFT_302120 [Pyronema domesticum]